MTAAVGTCERCVHGLFCPVHEADEQLRVVRGVLLAGVVGAGVWAGVAVLAWRVGRLVGAW